MNLLKRLVRKTLNQNKIPLSHRRHFCTSRLSITSNTFTWQSHSWLKKDTKLHPTHRCVATTQSSFIKPLVYYSNDRSDTQAIKAIEQKGCSPITDKPPFITYSSNNALPSLPPRRTSGSLKTKVEKNWLPNSPPISSAEKYH